MIQSNLVDGEVVEDIFFQDDANAGLKDFKDFLQSLVQESHSDYSSNVMEWLRDFGFRQIDEYFEHDREYALSAAVGLKKLGELLREENSDRDGEDRLLDWVLDAPYMLKSRITAQLLKQETVQWAVQIDCEDYEQSMRDENIDCPNLSEGLVIGAVAA